MGGSVSRIAATSSSAVALRLVVLWAALLALALLFGASAGRMAQRWTEPEYSHGFLIPLLAYFVLWRRRHCVIESADGGSWWGLALVGAGVALGILGSLAFADIPQVLGLILVLGGLGLAAFGHYAMRWVWGPLAFLLFTVPVPAPLYVAISTDLQLLSSDLGARMLGLAGVPVFLDGNIIDLGLMKLQVAEACSGLRYLFPLLSFGVIAAWLFRATWWARVLLVLSTVPITIGINSLRIALTGLVVEYASPELAEGFLHLFEGWVIFLLALVLFALVMWLLARLSGTRGSIGDLLDFDRLDGRGPRPARPRPATTFPVPLACALALIVAASPLNAALADRSESVPERPGLVTFPLRLDDWTGRPLPVDPEVLDELGADDYFLADYSPEGVGGPPVNLWIAYYDTQLRETWVHSPEVCLPGGGWEFVWMEDIDAPVDAADGKGFVLSRSLIANGRQRMVMYHWYEQRGKRYTDEVWARVNLLRDAFVLRRSDGALVRLLTPLRPGEDVADGERRLTALLRAVHPRLEPHVGL